MWARRFMLFHHTRHPHEMGVLEIEQCLSHLAVVDRVAARTQNHALYALLLVLTHVLTRGLTDLDDRRVLTPGPLSLGVYG